MGNFANARGLRRNGLAPARSRPWDRPERVDQDNWPSTRGCCPDNPELARFLDRLATVARGENDWKGAQGLYERSLALRLKALGPKHVEVAESLGGLADCATHAGRLQEAEKLYERALTIVRKPDGSYYPGAFDSLKGFAALLRATHRDARAAEMEALARSLESKR